MEGVVMQEEVIKDLIAVLLIDIPTLVISMHVLHTKAQYILTMLIVENLQFCYK